MATGFKYVPYTTDAGTVVRLRASAQTIAATGQAPITATVDDKRIFAYASNPGSKRKKALNARGVVLQRTVGTAPNTFVRKTFLPIFTKAALDAIELDSPITLNSVAYTVADLIDEA